METIVMKMMWMSKMINNIKNMKMQSLHMRRRTIRRNHVNTTFQALFSMVIGSWGKQCRLVDFRVSSSMKETKQ